MPLIKASEPIAESEPTIVESRKALLEQLAGHNIDEKRRAARALARDPASAPSLAARLLSEPEPAVRDALFGALVEIGGPLAANLLAPLLRSPDAGLRGGAVEALKRLQAYAVPVLDTLLDDPDPDTRILAVEVTRVWASALATPRLLRLIESDPHVNVCAAAVDVAAEVGTVDLIEALTKLPARFPSEPFLGFAVDVAKSSIRAAAEADA
jgi:HEAT repeat protein